MKTLASIKDMKEIKTTTSIYKIDGVDDGTNDLYKIGVLELNRLTHDYFTELIQQKKEIINQVNFDDIFILTLSLSRYPTKAYVVENKKYNFIFGNILYSTYCVIFSKNNKIREDKAIIDLESKCKELKISLDIYILENE